MKKILLLLFALTLFFPAFAQYQPENPLTHEMTEEERERLPEVLRDFYPTDPPDPPVRMVAEFEHMQGVLVRYPFGIPVSLIAEMSENVVVTTIVASYSEQQSVTSTYEGAGVNMDNTDWLIAPSDSYWTRDYGPWFVVNGDNEVGISNFPYNRPSRPNDNDIPIALANHLGVELYGMPLIHTGGNWMCDGWSTGASTELVEEENPALSNDSIESLVDNYLGIERYFIIDDPLGDYIKHIDCWGKFLDVDKVLIGQVPEWDPRYDDFEAAANYFALRTSAYGNLYQVYRVYTPGGNPATPYTNSLILNKKVLVPMTGNQWDDEALAVYEEAMPGYEVIGINHNNWANTDALHCRAKGIADLEMLRIKHKPLLGNKDFGLEWEVTADFIPYSGTGLKQDSLLVHYMVDSTNYETASFSHMQGATWKATLPFQEPESEIAYYIHAADHSGRRTEHPYIGQPDPHVFTVEYANDAVTSVDSLEFTTQEQMYEGLPFDIYNFTNGDLLLEDIETMGLYAVPWYIDPMPPATPHTMNYGDTLEINVKIDVIVENVMGDWVVDTLDFITENGTHRVIIKVDEDLLTGIEGPQAPGALQATVYPNPVQDNFSIDLYLQKPGRVKVDVLNVYGQQVASLTEKDLPKGSHTMNATLGRPAGIYLVRISLNGEAVIRKVVKR